MQINHSDNNNQTDEVTTFAQNLRYSLQRRLEELVALGQESLENLNENKLETTQQAENYWVLMEDHLRLVRNDWALYDWLKQ